MKSGELPSVSLVVAAYGAERTIRPCLDSLLTLRYPAELLEVIAVDNGSRDGTLAALEEYPGRVRALSEPVRGPAAARNTGIRHASGEVIALTDADCVVDAGWLAALVAPLADPLVGIAGGTIRAFPAAGAVERYGEIVHDHERAITHWRPPYVITMSWAARRSVVDALGPFDESLLRGSDVDYSYRAGAAGFRLAFAPDAVLFHHNERTLARLAREGFTHAFHSGAVSRRHAEYIERCRRQPRTRGDRPLQAPSTGASAVAFALGKRVGKAADRVRASRERSRGVPGTTS